MPVGICITLGNIWYIFSRMAQVLEKKSSYFTNYMLSPKQGIRDWPPTEPSHPLPVLVSRARIKTTYVRQMTQNLIIMHEQLTLLEKIGQGTYMCIGHWNPLHGSKGMVLFPSSPGEFGIVYKATLAPNDNTVGPEIRVAVKTLKGTEHKSDILVCV